MAFADLDRAVLRNRHFRKPQAAGGLGWGVHNAQIVRVLGNGGSAGRSERDFAKTVELWQIDNGFALCDCDGIIGPNTWSVLQRQIPGSGASPTTAQIARIEYRIPTVQQQGNLTCWLACLRMLASYRYSLGRSLNERARMLLSADFVQTFEDLDHSMPISQLGGVGRGFGMSPIHIPGFTQCAPSGIVLPAGYEILRSRGPFMFCGLIEGNRPHGIVINGWERGASETVLFVDPRFGRYQRINFLTFAQGFPPVDAAPLLVF